MTNKKFFKYALVIACFVSSALIVIGGSFAVAALVFDSFLDTPFMVALTAFSVIGIIYSSEIYAKIGMRMFRKAKCSTKTIMENCEEKVNESVNRFECTQTILPKKTCNVYLYFGKGLLKSETEAKIAENVYQTGKNIGLKAIDKNFYEFNAKTLENIHHMFHLEFESATDEEVNILKDIFEEGIETAKKFDA